MMQALPDAVLVWDISQQVRVSILQSFRIQYSDSEAIIDPRLGEVGIILYRNSHRHPDIRGSSNDDRAVAMPTMTQVLMK